METDILPIPAPCISESCIEIKINLNAYFYTSLRCLKRFNEGFQGIHKTFCGTTKKFLPWSGFGTGRVKICILIYQLIFNFFFFCFFFFGHEENIRLATTEERFYIFNFKNEGQRKNASSKVCSKAPFPKKDSYFSSSSLYFNFVF